ncbi:MAG: hypothetical protein KC449_18150 [Anaerolineales bacterium]|nr:hypothetical protein [Anaerolineales bacterium]
MFTLRFPFKLPSSQKISDPSFTRTVNNLQFSLSQQSKYYVLKVEGFKSENEAKDYVPKIWAGLMWILLNRGIAVEARTTLQKILYRTVGIVKNNQ